MTSFKEREKHIGCMKSNWLDEEMGGVRTME